MRKSILVISLFLMSGLLASPGVETETYLESGISVMEQSYLRCLKQNNIGVVEGALYCVIKIKKDNPGREMFDIRRVVERLSRTGETSGIRYKANVASVYLNNQELLESTLTSDSKSMVDGVEFWQTLVANIPMAYQ